MVAGLILMSTIASHGCDVEGSSPVNHEAASQPASG